MCVYRKPFGQSTGCQLFIASYSRRHFILLETCTLYLYMRLDACSLRAALRRNSRRSAPFFFCKEELYYFYVNATQKLILQ